MLNFGNLSALFCKKKKLNSKVKSTTFKDMKNHQLSLNILNMTGSENQKPSTDYLSIISYI